MDREIFRAICLRVAEEKDPKIEELFKQRLRLLLFDETELPEQGGRDRAEQCQP
jgi:hypothetical protein